MIKTAFQDRYPDDYANCYGCGRLNQKGLQIKSYWDGDESVCHFTPEPHHTGGFPDYLYGGLIASLVDCHGAGTAAAAKARSEGDVSDDQPIPRFVTASLKVDYLKPTPVNTTLELRGKIKEMTNRKTIVGVTLVAGNDIRATGEVVMVQIS